MNLKNSSKVIIKLNRDTKENLVKWEAIRTKPSSLSESEMLSENVYICKVLDRTLRLYRYQEKFYIDEERYQWTDNFRLEFLDKWGNSEWNFPSDRAIYDLYDTVRYKTSNVENFIDNFLTDEDKEDSDEDPLAWI